MSVATAEASLAEGHAALAGGDWTGARDAFAGRLLSQPGDDRVDDLGALGLVVELVPEPRVGPALDEGRARGIEAVYLEVRDSNQRARRLYRSRGFEEVGRRRGYYRRPVEDAIVLRRVYHHLTDPSNINASLLQSVRPGGVLVIIDLPPPFSWLRGSLGVPAQVVIDEIKASGFELVQLISDWPGRGPLENYCAVFRRPLTGASIHQLVPRKGQS